MKIWFTFILSLVFSIAGYTQLLELFSGHKASLSEWEINVSDLEKLKLIEPLRSSKLFEWPFNNLDNCQECLNSFHIIDFDLDGRKDILYYGLLGGESQYLVIIRNTNESFRELLVVAGSLNFVSSKSSLTPLSIGITQYGCCMEMVNQFEVYVPIWNNGDLKYQLAIKYGFAYGTDFPKETIRPIAFQTIKEEYKLRLSPSIDEGASKLEDTQFLGNQLAVYSKGSQGTAIAESIDDTGRTWWFVLMRNNIEPISTIMNEGENNSSNYYTMGWMSSRFVEIVD